SARPNSEPATIADGFFMHPPKPGRAHGSDHCILFVHLALSFGNFVARSARADRAIIALRGRPHMGEYKMRGTIALLFGAAAAALAMTTFATAETLKVAVAQRGFWNSSFVEFAVQQGFFKQEGLDIEILYTEGGASTLQPVVAGSIDIAMTNGTLGVIAAFSKGMPVKIISAEATGAPDAFWYARPESAIKSITDTNARPFAFSSPAPSTTPTALQLAAKEKAAPKLIAAGGAPATLTQVMSGQIDVGCSVPPFVLQQLAEGR